MTTTHTVPIATIQLTDRLNNLTGHDQQQDEVLFCCPPVTTDVIQLHERSAGKHLVGCFVVEMAQWEQRIALPKAWNISGGRAAAMEFARAAGLTPNDISREEFEELVIIFEASRRETLDQQWAKINKVFAESNARIARRTGEAGDSYADSVTSNSQGPAE